MANKVTLKNVADYVGVSTATVSYVLNGKQQSISDETKEAILNAVKVLGYYPNMNAKELASNRSQLIGVVVPQTEGDNKSVFANSFYGEILGSIEREARQHGYQVVISCADLDDNYIRIAYERNLSGIIAIGVYQDEILSKLSQTKIPVILIDSYCKTKDFGNVRIDDEQGSYLATSYLIRKGHRNIGFLCGHIQENGVMQKRFLGYRKALEETGIDLNPRWVFERKVSFEDGRMASADIVKALPDITGLICTADIMAIGLMKGLHAYKVEVPEDLSVVGFDDVEISNYLEPGLTTVHQAIAEKGAKAFDSLLNEIRGNGKQQDIILPVSIVERESVKELTR